LGSSEEQPTLPPLQKKIIQNTKLISPIHFLVVEQQQQSLAMPVVVV
jgi:hypothetical protein